MLRRIVRWMKRTLVTLVVAALIAALSDYLSHRVEPGSVLVVKLAGPVAERGGAGVLGALPTARWRPDAPSDAPA